MGDTNLENNLAATVKELQELAAKAALTKADNDINQLGKRVNDFGDLIEGLPKSQQDQYWPEFNKYMDQWEIIVNSIKANVITKASIDAQLREIESLYAHMSKTEGRIDPISVMKIAEKSKELLGSINKSLLTDDQKEEYIAKLAKLVKSTHVNVVARGYSAGRDQPPPASKKGEHRRFADKDSHLHKALQMRALGKEAHNKLDGVRRQLSESIQKMDKSVAQPPPTQGLSKR